RRLPGEGQRLRVGQLRRPQEGRRRDGGRARADSADARRAEANHRGDEVRRGAGGLMPSTATFRIWRGDAQSGKFEDYQTAVSDGMVVLDAVHQIQAETANDLAVRGNCKAGKCGSCSAEVNGHPRRVCMTRLNERDLDKAVTLEPMRASRLVKALVRDVSWKFRAQRSFKKFKPGPPDAPDGGWRMQQV